MAGQEEKVPEVFPSSVPLTGRTNCHRVLFFQGEPMGPQRDNLCQGTKPCHVIMLWPAQTFTLQVDIEAIGSPFSFSAGMRCLVIMVNEEQREGEREPENGKMEELNWWYELTLLHDASVKLAKILSSYCFGLVLIHTDYAASLPLQWITASLACVSSADQYRN